MWPISCNSLVLTVTFMHDNSLIVNFDIHDHHVEEIQIIIIILDNKGSSIIKGI